MTEKISSHFTEPIKFIWAFYLLQLAVRYLLYFFDIWDTGTGSADLFILIVFAIYTFDYWKLKEVEMTDSGLIITSKLAFRQDCIFVPYENIESARNKFWWLCDYKRITVKFKEETKFGKEIVFINKAYWIFNQRELLNQVNQNIARNRNLALNRPASPLSIISE